ncbi:type II secretion system protein [Colwellia piezophila]|uniref:type II secretion system protein n=1 Tax=Colwellia piezophila TaxID=211668 RepID=UPI000382610E|nr:type II secretion system protein [Colwellia piezophila]
MNNQGFTLIELVAVILLISILAVSVAPKFDGTAGYEAHAHRVQLIASLRLTQQRAMQQTDSTTGYCHELVFDNVQSRYGIPNRINCTPTNPVFPSDWQADATGHTVDTSYDISFNVNGNSNPQTVGFDWLGRPVGACAGGCEINVVSAVQTLKITIESEGYIHVFDLP